MLYIYIYIKWAPQHLLHAVGTCKLMPATASPYHFVLHMFIQSYRNDLGAARLDRKFSVVYGC
jgi:hypothetical protein